MSAPTQPTPESTASATREFVIRDLIIGRCGSRLTPDVCDALAAEVIAAVETGACAWAFQQPAPALDARKRAKERTKCAFERELNAGAFPAGVGEHGSGRHSANYGSWLKEHQHPEFVRQYEAWRDAK